MSYLPAASGGILPYYLLLTSTAAVYNVVQNYFISWQTKEIYSRKAEEITPLAARLFGTWTAVAALTRLYAAYNIANPASYDAALGTYLVACVHLTSEWLIFKSIKLNRGAGAVMAFGYPGLCWMLLQRSFYLGK